MKQAINLTLERPARKSGGDRYQGTGEWSTFQVYIPQSISRQSGTAINRLTIIFTDELGASTNAGTAPAPTLDQSV